MVVHIQGFHCDQECFGSYLSEDQSREDCIRGRNG